jgi:hypothetical protein
VPLSDAEGVCVCTSTISKKLAAAFFGVAFLSMQLAFISTMIQVYPKIELVDFSETLVEK